MRVPGALAVQITFAAMFTTLSACATSPPPPSPHETVPESISKPIEIDEALRQELLTMGYLEQSIRQELIDAGLDKRNPELLEEMKRVDAENTARLQSIVEERGWPGKSLVGDDGAEAAFLLLQHSTKSFQKKVLPRLQEAWTQGEVQGRHVAMLTDRVLVAEGKPQLYGTQALVEGGTNHSAPRHRRSESGSAPGGNGTRAHGRVSRLASRKVQAAARVRKSPAGFRSARRLTPLEDMTTLPCAHIGMSEAYSRPISNPEIDP